MFKQAGKLAAKEESKGPRSKDDDEPRGPNNGGQKQFPQEVKTVNMIYATHIPKKERKRALREVYAVEPIASKYNPWSAYPITFDRREHPTRTRHGGSATLALDPIINGYHLTKVLTGVGSSLNPIYSDTMKKMGIDLSRIKPSNTTFKRVIPGIEGCCSDTVNLEVVFGSPDNFCNES